MAQERDNTHKCDLCSEVVDYHWRCLECYEILCHRCKMIHLRGKATKGHHIMSMVNNDGKMSKKPHQRCRSLPPSHHRSSIQKSVLCPENVQESSTDSSENISNSDKKQGDRPARQTDTRTPRSRFKPIICSEPKPKYTKPRINVTDTEKQAHNPVNNDSDTTPTKKRSCSSLTNVNNPSGNGYQGSHLRSKSLPRCNVTNGDQDYNIIWAEDEQPVTSIKSSTSCSENIRSMPRNMNINSTPSKKADEGKMKPIESPRRNKLGQTLNPRERVLQNQQEVVLYNDINQPSNDTDKTVNRMTKYSVKHEIVDKQGGSNSIANRVAFADHQNDRNKSECKRDSTNYRPSSSRSDKHHEVDGTSTSPKDVVVAVSTRPKSLSVKDVERENLRCHNHPSERLRMFCKNCKSLICEECVETGNHKSHDLVKISTIAGKKRGQLEAHTHSLKDLLETVSDAVLANGKYVRTFKVLKSQMEKIAQTSESKISRFSYFNAKFVNAWLEIQERINKSEEILDSKESIIIESTDTIITDNVNIQTAVQETLEQWRDAISERKEDTSGIRNISEQSDECCSRHNSNTKTNVMLKKRIILSYDVSTILAMDRGELLTTEVFQNNIWKVKIDGTCIPFLVVEKNIISGMADFGKAGVLISCYSSQCVLLRRNDVPEHQEIIVTKPLYPRGVCHMHFGSIAVCVIDRMGNTANDTSVRAVHIYNEKGKLTKRIEVDKEGKRFFISPRKVQENYNGDLCVLDQTFYTSGTLVTIHKHGYLKYVYQGDTVDKSLRPFNPTDLACTRTSDVLIADFNNDRIYILCASGHCISVLDTKYHGIFLPFTIDVDNDDIIWLGARNEIYAMEILSE